MDSVCFLHIFAIEGIRGFFNIFPYPGIFIMETPIPDEFLTEMADVPGLNLPALKAALNLPPATSIRINSRKTDRDTLLKALSEEYNLTPVAWCNSGFYLDCRPQFTLNPLLHAGAFYVQDASSMIYNQLTSLLIDRLDSSANLRVLDMCAAPGGKTTAIIDALPDDAIVVANEYVGKRAVILRENLEKWGFANTIVTNSDSADIARCGELFDIVSVDAPCSGEGMMRKEEIARSQWNKGLVAHCSALQREIVANAVECLRPGGYLIYSTCTLNTHENELNCRYFLDMGLSPVELPLQGIPDSVFEISKKHFDLPALRFMPHITNGEGLFVAVFQKDATDNPDNFPLQYSAEYPYKHLYNHIRINNLEEIKRFIDTSSGIRNTKSKKTDNSYSKSVKISVKSAQVTEIEKTLLKNRIHIMTSGVYAAITKGNDIVPQTPLILSNIIAEDFLTRIELEKEEILNYLRRQSIALPPNTPKGYVIVTYKNIPVGLMKHIGNRSNNIYPAEWRIKNL